MPGRRRLHRPVETVTIKIFRTPTSGTTYALAHLHPRDVVLSLSLEGEGRVRVAASPSTHAPINSNQLTANPL